MTARRPPAKRGSAKKPAAARPRSGSGSVARKPAARKPAPRKSAARTPTARRPDGRLRRAAQGDRPYIVALLGLAVLLAMMAWTPLKSLTAGGERVAELTASRDGLRTEVDRLEDRKDALMDPAELELIARQELGLVKPGEIPYVVVAPEAEVELDGAEAAELPEMAPWYERVWDAVARLWREAPAGDAR